MYTDPSRPYAMPEAGMEYSAPLAFVDWDGNKDIVDYGKLYRLIRQAGRYFLLAVQNQADFAELLGGQQMKRGKNIPQDIDTSPISGPVRKGDTSHRHDKTKVIVRGKHPTGQLVRKPGNTPAERRKNSNLAGRNSPIEISDSGAEQEETNDKQTIFARGSNPGHIGEPPDDFQDDRFDSAGGEDHQEDELV